MSLIIPSGAQIVAVDRAGERLKKELKTDRRAAILDELNLMREF